MSSGKKSKSRKSKKSHKSALVSIGANPNPNAPRGTKDRLVPSVPAPPAKPPADEELWSGPGGKPNLQVLKEHLRLEGRLSHPQLSKLIKMATDVFRKEGNMLSITAPVTICGDVHGQFYDVLKLFDVGGDPKNVQYLFLGDYVDRGCFSSEIVMLLCAYKIHYPDRFWMIRGNHECRHMTDYFNFKEECKHKYSQKIYNEIMECFDALPLAALVNKQFLCLHGGISPEIKTLADIKKINRFREPPQSGPMADILWADPLEEYGEEQGNITFVPNEVRGCSYCYSYSAVCDFLDRNGLLCLIRAHEAQDQGYRMYAKDKKNGFPSLITMFSAPNYLDVYNNKGAILKYENNIMNIRQFNCVPHPYWLPGFMDCFGWSLPFVAEKVAELFMNILQVVQDEEDDEEEGLDNRGEAVRNKVRSVAKLLKLYSTLRKEQESIMHLKGLTDGHTIPRGILSGGAEAIAEAIDSFELARKADLDNERRPAFPKDLRVDEI